jgi:hypothetical protein
MAGRTGAGRAAFRFWTEEDPVMKPAIAICITAAFLSAMPLAPAAARSAYDGPWSLDFVTQRGACDAAYHFDVNINDGIVSHPNLVRFHGRVAPGGAVRASVTVQDKFAAGTGRLTMSTGRGTWSGQSAGARCSGYWTAQRG